MLAADQRRKEPRQVPRPGQTVTAPTGEVVSALNGHHQLLNAMIERGAIHHV